MEKGDWVRTPRFLNVRIQEVFPNRETAYQASYTEPTHYESNGYAVLGKSTGINHMVFAAAKL